MMHIPISTKNIGIPSQFEYKKNLTFRIEDFIKRLRWHCLFIGAPYFHPVIYDKPSNEKPQDTQCSQNVSQEDIPQFEERQWYGFKSENSPPVIKELIKFEE